MNGVGLWVGLPWPLLHYTLRMAHKSKKFLSLVLSFFAKSLVRACACVCVCAYAISMGHSISAHHIIGSSLPPLLQGGGGVYIGSIVCTKAKRLALAVPFGSWFIISP